LLEPYLANGEVGAKSGKGFYSYPDPEFGQAGFLEAGENIEVPHYAMTAALISNAILLASNDIADCDEIDHAWTVGMNLGKGPFAILDEMGLDAFRQLLDSGATLLSPAEAVVVERYLSQMDVPANA
jgi:3-hydroxybutyryl-CoA dehydrogenase